METIVFAEWHYQISNLKNPFRQRRHKIPKTPWVQGLKKKLVLAEFEKGSEEDGGDDHDDDGGDKEEEREENCFELRTSM